MAQRIERRREVAGAGVIANLTGDQRGCFAHANGMPVTSHEIYTIESY